MLAGAMGLGTIITIGLVDVMPLTAAAAATAAFVVGGRATVAEALMFGFSPLRELAEESLGGGGGAAAVAAETLSSCERLCWWWWWWWWWR